MSVPWGMKKMAGVIVEGDREGGSWESSRRVGKISRRGRAFLSNSGSTESRGGEEQGIGDGKTNEKNRKTKRGLDSHSQLPRHCTSYRLPRAFSSKGVTTGSFLWDPVHAGQLPTRQPAPGTEGREGSGSCTPRKSRTCSPFLGRQMGLMLLSPLRMPGATDMS